MTNAEIKKFSEQELGTKLMELKEQLFNLRFQHAINQLENPMQLNLVRKDIARVKTAIRQRQMAESKA